MRVGVRVGVRVGARVGVRVGPRVWGLRWVSGEGSLGVARARAICIESVEGGLAALEG